MRRSLRLLLSVADNAEPRTEMHAPTSPSRAEVSVTVIRCPTDAQTCRANSQSRCAHHQVPGQYVGVRLEHQDADVSSSATIGMRPADRLLAIASSPYDARRESSMLDASIIEVGCCKACREVAHRQLP